MKSFLTQIVHSDTPAFQHSRKFHKIEPQYKNIEKLLHTYRVLKINSQEIVQIILRNKHENSAKTNAPVSQVVCKKIHDY